MLRVARETVEKIVRKAFADVDEVVFGEQGDTDFGLSSLIQATPLGANARWWADPASADAATALALPDVWVEILWVDLGIGNPPLRVAWVRTLEAGAIAVRFGLSATRLDRHTVAVASCGAPLAVVAVKDSLDLAEALEVAVRGWYRTSCG